MLNRDTDSLADALRMQRTVLEEKRRLLDRAIQAIRTAEQSFAGGGRADTTVLKRIIEVIEMQNDNTCSKSITARRRARNPGAPEEWTLPIAGRDHRHGWTCSAMWRRCWTWTPRERDGAGAGRALEATGGEFTGGDPGSGTGLNKMYADRPNWPAHMQETMAPFSNPRYGR